MILVIPSILLSNGQCALCIEGEPGTKSIYNRISENPSELCMLLRRENAKSLHITDLDSYLGKKNYELLGSISECVDIPVQVLSDFSDYDECKYALDSGIYRIILNDIILNEPLTINKLMAEFNPQRFCAMINSAGGNVLFDRLDARPLIEYLKLLKTMGFQRIFVKVNDWLKNENGLDIQKIVDLQKIASMKITLYEGVNDYKQLLELNSLSISGIDSIVLEKALYENRFPCQKIWRLAEAELEN